MFNRQPIASILLCMRMADCVAAEGDRCPSAGMVLIRTIDRPLVPYRPGLSRGAPAAMDTPVGEPMICESEHCVHVL